MRDASAATASPNSAAGVGDDALRQAISRLPRDECGIYLLRLAQGESGLGLSLRRKLQADLKPLRQTAPGGQRSMADIVEAADKLKREEAERQASAAEKRRIADLEKLAKLEKQAWKDVDAWLAAGHTAKHYDQAVAQLNQLRELADYQKTRVEFNRRLRQLREQYKTRTSFNQRLAAAGLA